MGLRSGADAALVINEPVVDLTVHTRVHEKHIFYMKCTYC